MSIQPFSVYYYYCWTLAITGMKSFRLISSIHCNTFYKLVELQGHRNINHIDLLQWFDEAFINGRLRETIDKLKQKNILRYLFKCATASGMTFQNKKTQFQRGWCLSLSWSKYGGVSWFWHFRASDFHETFTRSSLALNMSRKLLLDP